MTQIGVDRRISFPWGGGGNHLINMLSLDDSFNAAYKDLEVTDPTIENKLSFIENKIYNSSRTWYNWLEYEWQTRPVFKKAIRPVHEYWDWEIPVGNTHVKNIPENCKILFLKFDNPQLLLDHYWHINLGINSMTPEKFTKRLNFWNLELSTIERRNFEECLVLDGEILHQAKLDEEFYNRICDWFGFARQFDNASKIHSMWVKCRTRSAKDFCEWVRGEEFQSYLQRMEKFNLL